jgi:hypothetical protein
VLHIATLHYGPALWIEIQARYLREHLSVPYRVWTSLGSANPSYASHFYRVIDQGGRHSDRLNHLALEILYEADDSDLLMFLDGDAFPIADPMPLINDGLSRAPLVAVRRDENLGDGQPHPCFCVTTVGTWRSLPGDWSGSYRWLDAQGKRVSDVGGNLLRALELSKTSWVPVLRSNRRNLDPIFFAIYGDVIYHHGAGFHAGLPTRAHLALAPPRMRLPRIPVVRRLVRRLDWQRRHAWQRRVSRAQVRESKRVFAAIERGGTDWLSDFT